MPVAEIMACEADGPVGMVIPRGPLCFGGAQLLRETQRTYPTSPFI